MNWQAVALDDADNVAIVLRSLKVGDRITVFRPSGLLEIVAAEAVPFCHKIALGEIAAGGAVLRYGQPIGEARQAIGNGHLVHTHNLVSRRAQGSGGAA